MGIGKNLNGREFGRLTVIRRHGNDRHKRRTWFCQCICGNVVIAATGSLLSKNTTSCGCSRGDGIAQHGHTRGANPTFEYTVWAGIVQRCCNPKNAAWKYYGGRGIKICARWRNSFEAFLEDMGHSPSPSYSIDRFPMNDGNYEPGNCRWATVKEQANNKRNNVVITFHGVTRTAKEWSEFLQIGYTTIIARYHRGLSAEQVLSPTHLTNMIGLTNG